MINIALAFVAGLVTTLSPCVIPVIPLVVSGASRAVKYGPVFLLLGLITSFSITGTFAASILFSLNLDTSVLTNIGAILLVLVGLFLLISGLDSFFKNITSGLSQGADSFLQKAELTGVWGQFIIGALIGLIWLPCTGPILGAAIGMAAQGENLFISFLTMLSFSMGASVPLALYSIAGQKISSKMSLFTTYSHHLRRATAVLFIVIGLSIYFGWHKSLETYLLELLPEWWINLITAL